jgi:hypothetical protein
MSPHAALVVSKNTSHGAKIRTVWFSVALPGEQAVC